MANATSTQLQELYVAYFGRAADPTGLDYWKEKGITTAAFAANMYAQPEFKSAYGSLTTESQVNQIYKNLFDRAADVTGLTYWTQQIKLGNLQLAEIANHLIWAAQNNSGSADDKKALTNRTDAAIAYTAKIKETTDGILAYQPLHNGLGTEEFSAGLNITEAVSYLSGIDKDTASTAAGIALSVSKITDNGVPSPNAKTYTLTSNTDNLTGSTGKDIYQGVFDAAGTGTGTTATSGDSMVGGTGEDTFNLSITGDPTGDSRTISGINADVEKILVSNFETGGEAAENHTFDAALSDGVTTVGLSASNDAGDTIFTNLKSLVNAEMSSGSGDLTVTHVDSVVSGTSDSATLTVSGQTAGTFKETSATAGGIETLNVVSKGSANTVNITSVRNITSAVNVSGDQNLTTTVGSTALTTVDASAFTGNLDLTYASAGDLTFTGGSGDDTFTFSADNFTSGDTVNGGAGDDILEIAGAITAATDLSKVSNIETLKLSGTKDVTLAADANVMNFDFTSTNVNVLTLNSGVSSAVTVTLGGTGADQVVNSANVGLTVKGSHTAIDASTLITGGTGTDTIELEGDNVSEDTAIDIAAGNITKVEKILVVDGGDATTGAESSTNKLSGDDVWLTTGAYATALEVDASALDAANKDNDSDGDIDSSDSSEEKLVFDGSSATGALTVTGGAGADTITSGTVNDVIDGGAGADTITSTGGNDNIKGGAGDDTINFTNTLTKDDVVDGGAGTDILSVTALNAATLVGVTNVETLAFTGSASVNADLSFDTIDLDSTADNSDSITFASGYAKATTVKVDAGDTVINNAKITVSVTGLASDFESADGTIVTGSSTTTNDSITVEATGSTVATSARITNVDTITVGDGGDSTTGAESSTNKLSGDDITIDLASYATALTIDASALDAANKDNDADGDIDSADASAEKLTITGTSAKALTVTGGSSDDTIIGSSDTAAGDTLKGGAGADTFNMGAGNLSYLDTIDGGAGTDIISVALDVSDVDFMKVSNAETLTIDEDGSISTNVLGAYFNASGITTVNLDPTNVSTISAAGTSGNITYNSKGNVAEAITAGLGDDTFLFNNVATIAATDAIDGGAGTDTISLDNSAASVTAVINIGDKVSNVEKIVVKDADGLAANSAETFNITIDGNGVAGVQGDNSTDNEDVQITIDASVITDTNDTVTYTLSDIGDADYSFVIKGGASVDDVTGSGVVDTISGNGGADVLKGGAGDDVIDGGVGDDDITGGTGQDTMTGGTGSDEFFFALASGEATVAKPDTITDFATGSDTIGVSLTITNGTTYDFTNKGAVTNASEAIGKLSSVAGQYIYNTATNTIQLDSDGNGLLQAGDFGLTLTGVSSLEDADIQFAITTVAAGGNTVTTGNGKDIITSLHAADVMTTGKGDDLIKVGENAVQTGTIAMGEGTDTLQFTHASGGLGIGTFTGITNLLIDEGKAAAILGANLETFNAVSGFSISGTAGSLNESVTFTSADGAASTVAFPNITFSNGANAVVNGGDDVDTFTLANGDDYIDGQEAADVLAGGLGNDTYEVGEDDTVNKYIETASGGTDTLSFGVAAAFDAQKVGINATDAAVGPLTNFEQVIFVDNTTNTFLASQLTGTSLKLNNTLDTNANIVTVGYATTADTVNLANLASTAFTYTGSDGETKTGKAFGGHASDILNHDPKGGADRITLSTDTAINDSINIDTLDSPPVAGEYDIITNFSASAAATADTLLLEVADIFANATIAVTEQNSSGITKAVVLNGMTTFTTSADATVAIDSATKLANVIATLNGDTDTDRVAKTLAFAVTGTAASNGVAGTFVYQGVAIAGGASNIFVELAGLTGVTALSATEAANTIHLG
ncbi:hypothetical protein DNJ72_09045 [Prochlorococcus marinus XMU1403]|uniref:DUF4214 domain-containing protein n=1 Tax=Prochlorococcus marinus TaxID=1219 RepID=UPI000D826387|nr:DUF4214 domain-containing protein [Prochlorococcus marinus]MBW3050285.1 hypothetical protein [Prochlorococcus marinus str. MU1403]PYE00471.1 hypothetical protein DNJ72_09045 [Prochlorococcus marinus XMU1403]